MVFEDITMDFITCLLGSKGKATIMTVSDRFSKYDHFIPLAAIFTAQTIAEAFGTSLAMSIAYHPQMDGQLEALNKCVEQYLHCFVDDSPHAWVSMLPWVEYWYNTAYQTSARMTLFQALYGWGPPSIACYILGSTTEDLIEKYMLRQDDVGEWVYVKLQPYRQHSLRNQTHHKLGRKYFGPYKQCTGNPNQKIMPLELTDSDFGNPQKLEDKVLILGGSIVANGSEQAKENGLERSEENKDSTVPSSAIGPSNEIGELCRRVRQK
ncbi:uncharacterized protein LOC107846699 [Capsicum annuum]|uniref:uncharacterized protein LOC107846699 n=1 Tax=Capsicum annuum TaxID=4072 RepID=UPI0007BF2CEB|nr:uncharacterized protein LOC107846699 [Capsicum annuum]